MDKSEIVKSRMDLVTTINEQPVILQVLGGLLVNGQEYIIITDCPMLEIGEDEYEILQFNKNHDGTETISSVDDEVQYNNLIKIWEEQISSATDN